MQGLRVLEVGDSRTGAYAGRLLAAGGAEVVLAEPSSGSALRDEVFAWTHLGANKASVSDDTLAAADPDAIVEAAADFDAVLLSTDGPSRPLAAAARSLRAARPSCIVTTITPYGLTGPNRDWRGGPLELWAAGGHLALNGERDRHPIPGGGAWDSHLVGAQAAVALQAEAIGRLDGPGGALVDVGALQVLAGSHQWSIVVYTHTGLVKERSGNRHGEMHHPLCLYPCSDGWVCIAAASFHQWEGLCIAMGRVELLADDDLANAAVRFDRADELDDVVTAWTSLHTVEEVVDACQSNFCPAGAVSDLVTMLDDPQLRFRRFWTSGRHLDADGVATELAVPDTPFRLPGTPSWKPPPELGSGTLQRREPSVLAPTVSGATDVGNDPSAPLAGVRVLELTISWAGPLAGRFLADLGAEVIKIEHPTSRGVAMLPPDPDAEPESWEWGELAPIAVRNGVYPDTEPGDEWWNRLSHHNKMNRSKQSLCLDIKGPGGREVFEALVSTADIVLNNYSPRGARSLGVDHETLRRIKPDVVTIDMTGFGASGPGAEAVSWGPILDSASGLAATTGYADSGPYKQGLAYPDPVGGSHGASAVLGAWWEHRRSGGAVHVDLSQLEALLFLAGDQAVEAAATGVSPPRRGARSARFAPAGVYPCAGEDRWVALTVYDDEDWRRLASRIGGLDRSEWVEAPARRIDHDAIDEVISGWTVSLTPHQAAAELQAIGVAAAVVATNKDLVEDPQLDERGFFVEITHAASDARIFPGAHYVVDGEPLPIRPLSALGADNDRILDELGIDADERDKLRATGTIATAPPT